MEIIFAVAVSILAFGLKMSRAYRSVRQVANEHGIDMRTAAFVLAIRRVGKAALARVHVETKLPF